MPIVCFPNIPTHLPAAARRTPIAKAVLALLFVVLTFCCGRLPLAQAQTLTTLHTFMGTDGDYPSSLVQGYDGSFYGVTADGNRGSGNTGFGRVFRLTPSGTLTVLHVFTGGADGNYPRSLVQGRDGNFYGTTYEGSNSQGYGSQGYGTVFRITPGGTLTTLHTFTGGADGASPYSLVQGRDGDFYGTTYHTSTDSTVFRMTPSGTVTTLYTFTDGSDGDGANSSLVQGDDGSIYGTTFFGGNNVPGVEGGTGYGTVFRLTPGGTLTALHVFAGEMDGTHPSSGLVQGSDGSFYGTTEHGSKNSGNGTVFRITPSGTLTTLHNFTNTEGYGADRLVQANDGNIYGTTSSYGTVFRMTPNGTVATQHAFTGGADGSAPSSLLQGSDGSFYGTTGNGGNTQGYSGYGTVFKLVPDHVWTATSNAPGPDGQSHVLWDNLDGRMVVWTLNPDGAKAAQSPFYGPFPGWTAQAVSVGPDNVTRVLWDNTDGRMIVWLLSADGTQTQTPFYGPFAGWAAKAVSVGPDNVTRILWDNLDGRMIVWLLSPQGAQTQSDYFGPYEGWTALGVSVDRGNSGHILWGNVDGRMTTWTLTPQSQLVGSFPTYGPY